MTLNRDQRKRFYEALLSAYRRREDLARMVRLELGESLNEICAPSALPDTVLELIDWSDAAGKVEELVRAARVDRAGNKLLQQFEADMDRAALAMERAKLAAEPWSYRETGSFASPDVLRSLVDYPNRDVFAVDDGVMLYLRGHFRPLPLEEIKVICSSSGVLTNDPLVNPNEEQLLDVIETQVQNAQVRAYLRRFATGRERDTFQNKVGLLGFDCAVKLLPRGLTLHIAPLSFWIIRHFNRRMLRQPADEELLEIRRQGLKKILPRSTATTFPCPSALYVEVSVVTEDNMLVIVEKQSSLSALARGPRRWTCTVEYGPIWADDVGEDYLDLEGAVKRGLEAELEIKPEEIETITFYGLALEHPHLNTGWLGVVKIGIPYAEVKRRIADSYDLGPGDRPVHIESAMELFPEWGSDTRDNSWHPTARMRILLAAYQFMGHDEFLARLDRHWKTSGRK